MNIDHTPGPWDWAENPYEPNKFSIGADGRWLMSIQHNGEQLVEKQRANMALIAAAPELLEAIQALLPHVLHYAAMPNAHSDTHRDAANARAVITKATGDAA